MKFTILKNELYAVKNAGYELDFTQKYGERLASFFEEQNAIENAIDSFKDLDGAALCRGDDGELYAVEFYYTGEPMIWQRVRRTA